MVSGLHGKVVSGVDKNGVGAAKVLGLQGDDHATAAEDVADDVHGGVWPHHQHVARVFRPAATVHTLHWETSKTIYF